MENSKYIVGNLETNTNQSIGLESDKFWLEDFGILFDKNRLADFFPSYSMTLVEKLNAMTRLSIFLSIILYLVTKNYLYFFIMILMMLFTVFIFKTQLKNLELYFNSYDSDVNIINEKVLSKPETVLPSVNNPFMNINLITDDKTKAPATPFWNNPEVKKEVEDKFGYNLYRDVSDVYNKDHSQRQYYQMPSTTIPNDQTSFAKYCFATGPTCKEDSIYCSVGQIPLPEFPSISTTNPYTHVVQKY